MFGVPSSCLHLWCNGTVRWYARLVRKGKLPCASGRAYVSQEAGTRTLYVEHGCGTAYMYMHMSTQASPQHSAPAVNGTGEDARAVGP